jgi:Y-X(10)_GDL-associated radical SAM protein
MEKPVRFREKEDFRDSVPVHCVWEITLACDLKCRHCGSRAGKRRTDELSTEECFGVIESLARLGTREVSLIGGEAYMRRDWPDLVRHIRQNGMRCVIQTGGLNFNQKFVDAAVDAGLDGVGVSLDGMEELHDYLRGVPGSFNRAVGTLRRVRDAGLSISVNSQIGSRTAPDLPGILDTIIEVGAKQWQLQLTVAMGNAVDNDELLLQPYKLTEIMPLLAELHARARENNVLVIPGNNIGYFGPYEHIWRGLGDDRYHWTGCSGGHTVIALEADGLVKGCPSLESGEFGVGNIREMSMDDMWHRNERMRFSRLRSSEQLSGFCGTCYYKDVCLGGCTWTSHSLFGEVGNNPYCHYRVLELKKQGLRERIVKKENAPDNSFAIGKFDLVSEPIDAPLPKSVPMQSSFVRITRARKTESPVTTEKIRNDQRAPIELALCRNCGEYVYKHETTCPHCKGDIEEARVLWVSKRKQALASQAKLERALAVLKGGFISDEISSSNNNLLT